LVILGVRFVSINDRYDSFRNPLSNLELAVINLANEQYNRDIAMKSASAKRMKMRRGEFMGGWAPFGYKRSNLMRNKLVIDETAAEYVRLIFSLAISGNNFTKIAYILNAQGIPTPSEYKRQWGIVGWRDKDYDYRFWTSTSVGRIVNYAQYTGDAVGNRSVSTKRGVRRCQIRPKDEWIVVPGANEAIVSKADFDLAHEAIRKKRLSDAPIDHIFQGKITCPICGRIMNRQSPRNPAFKCYTRYFTDHYNCPKITIPQAKIEEAVLASLKVHVAVLIEREELRLHAIRDGLADKDELKSRIKAEESAIRSLEESITNIFTQLASDKISKDAFLSKKAVINDAISQKKVSLASLREQLDGLNAGSDATEKHLSELRPLSRLRRSTRNWPIF